MAGCYSHRQLADHGCVQRTLSNFRSRSSTMIVRAALLVAWNLFAAWFSPYSGQGLDWLHIAGYLVGLEFVLIHSGVFMGLTAVKLRNPIYRLGALLGLAAVYAVLAFAFSESDLSSPVFRTYGLVIFGRLAGALVPSHADGDSGLTVVLGLTSTCRCCSPSTSCLGPTLVSQTRPSGWRKSSGEKSLIALTPSSVAVPSIFSSWAPPAPMHLGCRQRNPGLPNGEVRLVWATRGDRQRKTTTNVARTKLVPGRPEAPAGLSVAGEPAAPRNREPRLH